MLDVDDKWTYNKLMVQSQYIDKYDVVGTNLVFKLGFSHPINVAIPKNLKVASEKNIITISDRRGSKSDQHMRAIAGCIKNTTG